MKFHSTLPALIALALAACAPGESNEPADADEINVNPASLAEASKSIAQIQQLQKIDPNHPRAVAAIEKLNARLDELNHLIARIEPKPGITVSFYAPRDGVVVVAEGGAIGTSGVLDAPEVQGLSPAEMYRKLTGGTEPPTALNEVTHATEGSPATEEPIAAPGESDTTFEPTVPAEWFRDNRCFTSGDRYRCMPDEKGLSFVVFRATRTSFTEILVEEGPAFKFELEIEDDTVFAQTLKGGDWKRYWGHSRSIAGQYLQDRHEWSAYASDENHYRWTAAAKWQCIHVETCNVWPRQGS